MLAVALCGQRDRVIFMIRRASSMRPSSARIAALASSSSGEPIAPDRANWIAINVVAIGAGSEMTERHRQTSIVVDRIARIHRDQPAHGRDALWLAAAINVGLGLQVKGKTVLRVEGYARSASARAASQSPRRKSLAIPRVR